MELGLKNKVAFVAASSQGLGKSVAIELAKEDVNLIICGRNQKSLNQAKKEIKLAGNVKVLALVGDLSKTKDREYFVEETLKKFDTLDILITNTGGPPSGKFEDLEQEQWNAAYEQLLACTVHLIRGFLPRMKQQPWGRIISITSQAVKQPVDNLILSNAVRASVAGLNKSLANELGAYNITVNNVMPGYTETERLSNLIQTDPSFASATNTIPLGRFGKPEEFAAAVTFLASERASYITGVSLAIDGGWIKHIL